MDLAERDGIRRLMMKCIQAQHAIERLVGERQLLSSRGHVRGVIAEHEPVVAGETLAAAAHHLHGEVDGNGANADPVQQFGRPARARGEIEDEIVWSGREQLARHREVEQVRPAQTQAGPVQRKVEAVVTSCFSSARSAASETRLMLGTSRFSHANSSSALIESIASSPGNSRFV
jgi:hypothetical protein